MFFCMMGMHVDLVLHDGHHTQLVTSKTIQKGLSGPGFSGPVRKRPQAADLEGPSWVWKGIGSAGPLRRLLPAGGGVTNRRVTIRVGRRFGSWRSMHTQTTDSISTQVDSEELVSFASLWSCGGGVVMCSPLILAYSGSPFDPSYNHDFSHHTLFQITPSRLPWRTQRLHVSFALRCDRPPSSSEMFHGFEVEWTAASSKGRQVDPLHRAWRYCFFPGLTQDGDGDWRCLWNSGVGRQSGFGYDIFMDFTGVSFE